MTDPSTENATRPTGAEPVPMFLLLVGFNGCTRPTLSSNIPLFMLPHVVEELLETVRARLAAAEKKSEDSPPMTEGE